MDRFTQASLGGQACSRKGSALSGFIVNEVLVTLTLDYIIIHLSVILVLKLK